MPNLKVYKLNKDTLQADQLGTQTFYSTDGETSLSEWIKTGKKAGKVEGPLQSSGLRFKAKGYGSCYKDMLGGMYNDNNNVYKNAHSVALFSSGFSSAHSQTIFPSNFFRCIVCFAARKLIIPTWINQKLEYLAPKPSPSRQLSRFAADALVYSIFHPSNNMTAVRDVEHKGKSYRIKNNMFWRKRDFMRNLANKHAFHEMFNDIRNEPEESYIRKENSDTISPLDFWEDVKNSWRVDIADTKIFKDPYGDGGSVILPPSPLAQKVLDMADALLVESMEMRQAFHATTPEYNLHAWDAGYYQLKYLWRELYPEQYEAFRAAYKELEEYLRPQVYELGMLKSE